MQKSTVRLSKLERSRIVQFLNAIDSCQIMQILGVSQNDALILEDDLHTLKMQLKSCLNQ